MQQTQQVIKEHQGCIVCGAVHRGAVGRFHHFEIPGRELIPEQAVNHHQGFGDAELAEEVVDFSHRCCQTGLEPCYSCLRRLRLLSVGHIPAFHQAECIPDLVAEIAALLAERVVIHDVMTGGCGKHYPHADTVGAEFCYEFQRVGRIAERLRHLSAEFVAYDTGEINVAERFVAAELISGDNHARHPEENDVGRGNQIGCGIIVFELLVVGFKDAVEQRYGPQPRREPCVEAVGILLQVVERQRGVAALLYGLHKRLLLSFGHNEAAAGKEICGDAVTPPKMTRDAPVLDVGHPVTVKVLEFGWHIFDIIRLYGFKSGFGKVFHLYKPLHRQFRLDNRVSTFGMSHLVDIILHLLYEPCGFKVNHDLLAHIKAVHAHIHATLFGDSAVVVEYVD